MKQIKIWLEVCPFDRTIFVKFENYADENIQKIIEQKVIFNSLTYIDISTRYYKLKKGETRESVIASLWTLQKSLLPSKIKEQSLNGFYEVKTNDSILYKIDSDLYEPERTYCFYDEKSRVITITQFDEVKQ